MWRAAMLYLSCVVACGTVLPGCVPLRSAADPESTLQLEVRLHGEHTSADPVIGLMISVDAEQGPLGKRFAFAPQERISRDYTDFLVRLGLPAGRYQLRRVSGVTRGGAVMPQFDVDAAMAFRLRRGATNDLGRMEIGNAASASAAEAGTEVEIAASLLAVMSQGLPLPAEEPASIAEGYVDLFFAASATGEAEDIVVAGSQPRGLFDEAAIAALKHWRLPPREADGAATDQQLKLRLRFVLQAE